MKFILTTLLFLSATLAFTQKKGATMRDLDGLPGSWTGQMTHTESSDDKTQITVPAKVDIVNAADSLLLNYSYTDPGRKLIINKGDLRIYDDGKQLSYDGYQYDISAVRRVGSRLTIIAERDGTDNNKEAIIRQTFIIGPGVFNVNKEVKYEGTEKFFMRNSMLLRKAGT